MLGSAEGGTIVVVMVVYVDLIGTCPGVATPTSATWTCVILVPPGMAEAAPFCVATTIAALPRIYVMTITTSGSKSASHNTHRLSHERYSEGLDVDTAASIQQFYMSAAEVLTCKTHFSSNQSKLCS
jgi:hypothetical protein